MRIIIVNHCHPDMAHVCALRAKAFARVLAGLGHDVLLLTQSLDGGEPPAPPERLAAALRSHDFARPFHLGCAPRARPLLAAARDGVLPPGVRHAVLGLSYAFQGGVFGDWVAGTRPYWTILADEFAPQAVWAIFGNTDAWNIGRAIAALARCPWVMDVKDNWQVFIPAVLRRRLANRFTAAAAMTVFSRRHGAIAGNWFGQPRTVVYSGLSDAAARREAAGEFDRASHPILLSGSLYGAASLGQFMDALGAWLAALPGDGERAQVTLHYAGSDGARMAAAAAGVGGLGGFEDHGFLDLDELARLQAGAWVNVYLRNPEVPFHHKIFEHLASGRPTLCFPAESAEAIELAAAVGAPFFSCAAAGDVVRALSDLWEGGGGERPDRAKLAAYSWEAQGKILAGVLLSVAGAATGEGAR